MALRVPTVAMLLLLVACASTREGPPRGDPTYLEGITTRYSIRLDELRPQATHRHADLPGAVVAGDETITATGSLMREGPYLALDLVIQNRGDQTLVLHRENLKLRDNLGTRLAAVADFEGAEHLGLRGQATQRVAQGLQPDLTVGTTTAAPSPLTLRSEAPRKQTPRETGDRPVASSDPRGWGSDVTAEARAAAPEAIFLDPGEHRAYWAYWMAESVEYPLFVMIHLDGRSLLMKFGATTAP